MSPRLIERAYLKSARQYHQSPVARFSAPDQPRRYDVALDPWDDPDAARREMDRAQFRAVRRAH
jgi:hypothetical protein